MRSLLTLVVTAGVIAGAGAGAAPGAESRVRALDVQGISSARVTYLMHAEFGLDYEVEWVETSGDRYAECSSWTDDRGSNEVLAGSTKPMRGRLTLYERTYHAPLATIRAEIRRGNQTLKLLTTPVLPNSSQPHNKYAALSVTAVGIVPYRNCKTSRYAPELPGNMAILVREPEKKKLRELKPGERMRIERTRYGDCDNPLPRDAACRFKLDMHIDIRRWKPGTPY